LELVPRNHIDARGANAVRLVTHTRWHDDDLIGRILNSFDARWTVLSLPAIAVEDDALHRAPGEALWPERYPIEQLERQRSISARRRSRRSTSRIRCHAGGLFQAEWFEALSAVTEPECACGHSDGRFGLETGVGNDYSVIATWGTNGRDYYLLNVWRAKAEYYDLRRIVVEKFREFRPRALYVEEASSGFALLSELRQTTPIPIIPVRASGSKQARAERATPFFEAGRVHLPEEAPWLPAWIREHLRFPADKHDDQVDTTDGARAPESAQFVRHSATRDRRFTTHRMDGPVAETAPPAKLSKLS
jgi:predicted phage terminase large subunit-like protein